MVKLLEISQKMGYLGDLRNVLIDTKAVNSTPPNRVMVIATGAQGEEMAALSRIINGTHQDIAINKGDTVLLSASVIPGNEMDVQGLIDKLSIQGAIVLHSGDDMDLHTSGHGYQEDQKIMLNLVKPKYFMPVHGYQSFLYKHAQNAISVGMDERHIVIPRRGEIIKFTRNGFTREKPVKNNPILISGAGVGDIGEIVMSERQQLGNNGVIVYSAVISKANRKLAENPVLASKGFTYFRDNAVLFDDLSNVGKDIIESAIREGKGSKEIKEIVKNKFQKVIFKAMEREPLIMVMISEV
jgi:ribonuclease J